MAATGERFELRVPAADLEAWQARAEAEGVTVAELVRSAMANRLVVAVGESVADRRMIAFARRVLALAAKV